MNVRYLVDKAYEDLHNNINSNKTKYVTKKPWLKQYFKKGNYYDTSSVEVTDVTLESKDVATTQDINRQDLSNVILLYGSFKNLTPWQATNPKMWAYLAHEKYYEYVVTRWMKKPDVTTISYRFFLKGRKGLFHNAVSRLWWFGYLTHKEGERQQWRLTETLLTNQQIAMDVLDMNYSNNKKVLHAMLEALADYKEEYPHETALTMKWRACVQYINRVGAYSVLDFYTPEDVRKMTYDYLVAYTQ